MGQRGPSTLNEAHRSSRGATHARPPSEAVVIPEQGKSGFNPPQQARSRAALRRLLASAEEVLVSDGLDEFTIARVAEHAGVSVGGVYRRFASKEQLIEAVKQGLMEKLEQAMGEALEEARPSLGGVVEAFIAALSDFLNECGPIIPALLAGARSVEAPEEGLRTVMTLQRRFLDAAAAHQDEICHADPVAALKIAYRSVIGAGAHRAAISPWLPDDVTWDEWARETTDMIAAYLTYKRQNGSSTT